MTFLVLSFIAGVLTVLAPCILPLLPVVLGTSATGRSKATPYIVVASLALSIIIFTFLLKFSTALITVPQAFWTGLSGGILILFGFVLVFPGLWEKIPGINRLSRGSNKLVGTGFQKKSFWGDALIGAALGPVFSSCSPTYFVILASVLPASFALGTLYLLAYVAGLSLVLIAIALIGQRFADRLAGLADPHSRFKRVVGVVFILLGLFIISGYEKRFATWILESGFVDAVRWEQNLLEKYNAEEMMPESGEMRFAEIVQPAGFINTDRISLGELVGKKVILVDFMTYSCINCIRTFPYVNAWYEKYKDQGLEIIGIHTPEFAFEKDLDNVREALDSYGIKFPVVLDNDYATWRAYGNQYWPRKYLIDIHGNIVYDHIGEGGYVETEMMIRRALQDRALKLGEVIPNETAPLVGILNPEERKFSQTPEIYFGSDRNELLGNQRPFTEGVLTLSVPTTLKRDALYLGGSWNITPEHAESLTEDAIITLRYTARDVYFVASADAPVEIEITQDGKPVGSAAGDDVQDGRANINEERLYKLIRNPGGEEHVLEIKVRGKGLKAFTFTFG